MADSKRAGRRSEPFGQKAASQRRANKEDTQAVIFRHSLALPSPGEEEHDLSNLLATLEARSTLRRKIHGIRDGSGGVPSSAAAPASGPLLCCCSCFRPPGTAPVQVCGSGLPLPSPLNTPSIGMRRGAHGRAYACTGVCMGLASQQAASEAR